MVIIVLEDCNMIYMILSRITGGDCVLARVTEQEYGETITPIRKISAPLVLAYPDSSASSSTVLE